MANEVRIPVLAGLITHGGIIKEVVLQPPSFDDYIELGDITTWGRTPDKTLFTVENTEVLREYIKRCLVQPKNDPLALGQGGLKLARAVKGAVIGFFQDDSSKDEPSQTSPTTSSSDVAKDASAPMTSVA